MMLRYLALMVLFLIITGLPNLLPAEESGGLERTLENALNIFLGTVLQGGVTGETGEQRFTAEEVDGLYIASRFRIVLNRDPTASEVNHYKRRLARGYLSDEEFINTLFDNGEYRTRRENRQAHIKTLYDALFDREPTGGELHLYAGLLQSRSISRLQLRNMLLREMEFQTGGLARKALVRNGTVRAAIHELARELHNEARGTAEQIRQGTGRGSLRLEEVEKGLLTLADVSGAIRKLAESGAEGNERYRFMAEDTGYLLYSIDKSIKYREGPGFPTYYWNDTKKLGLTLLRVMNYVDSTEPGDGGTSTTLPGQPTFERYIELRVIRSTRADISNALNLASDTARDVARYVLDKFNDYTIEKGMSLIEEFELERSLTLVANRQGIPRNIGISNMGRGRYIVYYLPNVF